MSRQLGRSERARADVNGTGSIPDGPPYWRLEGVEADHCAGQHRQGIEAFRGALVADPQPPEAAQPSAGPLDRPAVAAKPL
jgi:hypothetical protein